MKRWFPFLVAALALAAVIVAGCSQAAPATAPTKAPDTKAAPAAAAPTTAPAAAPAKSAYPEKGKVITLIIPWGAGGGSDVGARLLTPLIEKNLGVTIEVVNKTGGGSQVGITDLVTSKPDGYTFGMTNLPATAAIYLDADRQASFGRKDLQPVALHVFDPISVAVRQDSPFKTMKDFMDAAKANPGGVKIGTSGILSATHIGFLSLEKSAGVKFSYVPFDSSGQQRSATLGGHVDAEGGSAGEFVPGVKSGDLRVLGVFDTQKSKFLPDVPTAQEQGYTIVAATSRGFSVPAGTSMDVVNALSEAIKTAMDDPEHKAKMDEQGLALRYMTPEEFGKYWDEVDTTLKPILEEAKKK